MSVHVSSKVWSESKQSGDRLLLMLALADYCDDAGRCWPSQLSLAARIRCTERGVQKMIDAMLECGEIEIMRAGGGRGRSAEYCLSKYVKGERGSPIVSDVKGERHSPNAETRKGERGDRKGERESVKGEQAVPPNHQGTVKEPSMEPSLGVAKKKKKRTPRAKKAAPETVKLPTELNTQAFRDAWTDWLKYRAERRLPRPVAMSVQKKLEEMAKWGVVVAIQGINESISNHWQGIFLPKPTGHNGNGADAAARHAKKEATQYANEPGLTPVFDPIAATSKP